VGDPNRVTAISNRPYQPVGMGVERASPTFRRVCPARRVPPVDIGRSTYQRMKPERHLIRPYVQPVVNWGGGVTVPGRGPMAVVEYGG